MTRLLTTLEAAERLSISRRTVQEMLARRELPRIHVGKAVRIPEADLEAWIAARVEQPISKVDEPAPLSLRRFA